MTGVIPVPDEIDVEPPPLNVMGPVPNDVLVLIGPVPKDVPNEIGPVPKDVPKPVAPVPSVPPTFVDVPIVLSPVPTALEVMPAPMFAKLAFVSDTAASGSAELTSATASSSSGAAGSDAQPASASATRIDERQLKRDMFKTSSARASCSR